MSTDDRPSTDALLGAWPGLRYENDGRDRPTDDHGAVGFCTDHGRRGMGAEDYCTCDRPWPCSLAVTDTPTEGAHLRVLPRERYDAPLDSGPIPPAVGRLCGWCGGPHHDPGDCPVAQQAEAQRLCDEDRHYAEDDGGADCG